MLTPAERAQSARGRGSACRTVGRCRRRRGVLGNSGGAEVIEELATLRDSGECPALGDHPQGETDCFTVNQPCTDYRRPCEPRLPIGSGTVESACQHLGAARLKQSAMMWSLPGAAGMLRMPASINSRRSRSGHERLLPLSPPREAAPPAARSVTLSECTRWPPMDRATDPSPRTMAAFLAARDLLMLPIMAAPSCSLPRSRPAASRAHTASTASP